MSVWGHVRCFRLGTELHSSMDIRPVMNTCTELPSSAGHRFKLHSMHVWTSTLLTPSRGLGSRLLAAPWCREAAKERVLALVRDYGCACRLLAVLCALLSLAVVVAEATISEALPNLSVFSWALHRVSNNEILTELLTFAFLAYPCICAYYALYRLGR